MKVIMMVVMMLLLFCNRDRWAAAKQNDETRRRKMLEQCRVSGGYSTSATPELRCVLFSQTFMADLWGGLKKKERSCHKCIAITAFTTVFR